MTSRQRAIARAAREAAAAEADALRRRRARRARIVAALTTPFRFRLSRTGRTGKLRRRRGRAERMRIALVLTGLVLLLVAVFATFDAWPLRIGAVLLAGLIAPVLIVLVAPASA